MRDNTIIIADRDFRVYLGECDLLFLKYDQIILKGLEAYRDKMIHISNIKKGLGIEISKDFLGAWGKIKFKTEDICIMDNKTGREKTSTCYLLGLTKRPELFMFTDPDKDINKEIEKIK